MNPKGFKLDPNSDYLENMCLSSELLDKQKLFF